MKWRWMDIAAELRVAWDDDCQHQNALRAIIWSRFINNLTNSSNVSQSFTIFLDQIFYKSLTQNCKEMHSQSLRLKNLIFEFENLQFLSIDRIQFKFYGCFKMSRLVNLTIFSRLVTSSDWQNAILSHYLSIFVSQSLGPCQLPSWPNTGTGKFIN